MKFVTKFARVGNLPEGTPWLVDVRKPDGPCADLAKLRHAIGESRIKALADRAVAMYTQDKKKFANTDAHMTPDHATPDTLHEMAWVPRDWMTRGLTPELCADVGTPWVVTSGRGAARAINMSWPMPGVACWIMPTAGSAIVTLVSYADILDVGATVADGIGCLREMKWQDFGTMKGKLQFVTLEPGHALWVPYGWLLMSLSRAPTDTPFQVVYLPYLSSRMLMTCTHKDHVIALALAMARRKVDTQTTLRSQYMALVKWLSTMLAQTTDTQESSLPGLPRSAFEGEEQVSQLYGTHGEPLPLQN